MSFRHKKHLGQHFLTDDNIVRKIAAEVAGAEHLVEVGPGTGALTKELLREHPDLTVVEVDSEAIVVLREKFPSLRILEQDVLSIDWLHVSKDRGGVLTVIGNLPYYITSPILLTLLEARDALQRAVVMVQKEVGDRIVASHGSKTYGTLSVYFQTFAQVERLFDVSRHCFTPAPNVESTVLSIDFNARAPEGVALSSLQRVVRMAFGQRRKMLRNSLAPLESETGRLIPDAVQTRRPEALSPREFIDLTRNFFGS